MKKKARWTIIFCMLFAILPMVSCNVEQTYNGEEAERAHIVITVRRGLENYPQVAALSDETFMEELCNRLNVDISIKDIEADWDLSQVEKIPFEDILITNDPYWILPLAENKIIRRQQRMVGEDAAYGMYYGYQYAYVFSNSKKTKKTYILVLPEELKEMGLINLPYTAESFREVLIALKGSDDGSAEPYRYPLAVSGSPLDAQYSLLLQLFQLSPRGGAECADGEETVIFDKLTENGYNYINYLNDLYKDELVSPEFLVLPESANIRMMTNHISAIGLYTEPLFVKETVNQLREKGISVAYVNLPVSDAEIETDVYKRLVGMVHAKSAHPKLAEQILSELEQYQGYNEADNPLEGIEEYRLFSENVYSAKPSDSLLLQPYSLLNVYRLFENDQSLLESFYQEAAIDGTDKTKFDNMVNTWLSLPRGDKVEDIDGYSLLRYFAAANK